MIEPSALSVARDIGGGVRVEVSRNDDGSYTVSVTGSRVAPVAQWCTHIWFAYGEYETGCSLDTPNEPALREGLP